MDSAKIDKILTRLNKGLKTPEWEEGEGLHALSVIRIDTDNSFTLDSSQVLIVKTFINSKTGEIRSFHIRSVRKD